MCIISSLLGGGIYNGKPHIYIYILFVSVHTSQEKKKQICEIIIRDHKLIDKDRRKPLASDALTHCAHHMGNVGSTFHSFVLIGA